jgi:non-ribosomal peptide synthetase component F
MPSATLTPAVPVTKLEASVVDLFDVWADKTPNATAIEWNGQTLSFAELRDASFHVSRALLSAGAQPGDMVPVLSQMSLQLVPSILGVLRVGACYVAIDAEAWSEARIAATLEDISPRVVITTVDVGAYNEAQKHIPVNHLRFRDSWLQSGFEDIDGTRDQLDAIRQSLDNRALVYTSFTSGTSGKPKGVMIYHQALYRFVMLESEISLKACPGERVLMAFSISFDGKPPTEAPPPSDLFTQYLFPEY